MHIFVYRSFSCEFFGTSDCCSWRVRCPRLLALVRCRAHQGQRHSSMCICCNPNADFHDTKGTFVTPSGGKSDCCGQNCGPLSHVCPFLQLIILGRDPKFDQDNIEYEYDDDADKTMWCKCAAFAITCAPLFIILDVTASVIPFFQGKNYEKSCCQGCPGFKDKVTLRQPQASKAPASKEMERT